MAKVFLTRFIIFYRYCPCFLVHVLISLLLYISHFCLLDNQHTVLVENIVSSLRVAPIPSIDIRALNSSKYSAVFSNSPQEVKKSEKQVSIAKACFYNMYNV
jgi:hypothetical protein